MSLERAYNKADQQRAMALRYALNTVDLFALEIGNPDIMNSWEQLKKILLEEYTPERTDYLEEFFGEEMKQYTISSANELKERVIDYLKTQGGSYYNPAMPISVEGEEGNIRGKYAFERID